MDSQKSSLFQVFLRLRPPLSLYPQLPNISSPSPTAAAAERFLTVEPPSPASIAAPSFEVESQQRGSHPTHITIHPPSDSRKRAVEKFGFTRVFEEATTQLEVFEDIGAPGLVEGVLHSGRDGLLATLGVTGSGKSHTILGSKSQRGLTQLSLDVLFRSIEGKTLHPGASASLVPSLVAADASEAQIQSAAGFLESVYGDINAHASRAATPMTVCDQTIPIAEREGKGNDKQGKGKKQGLWQQWDLLGLRGGSENAAAENRKVVAEEMISLEKEMQENEKQQKMPVKEWQSPSRFAFWQSPRPKPSTKTKLRSGNAKQDVSFAPRRHGPQRPSALPTLPDISSIIVSSSEGMDYAILVSMYEVYNDRIFDLLTQPRNTKDARRRPLLFKPTEGSPDRKVVAGLRKIVCGNYEEALMILETGLTERRVAGTGSNSVSSRSHGFFCMEVKKRPRGGISSAWTGSQLTIVDLAGSERARNAKTAGATLAEAGKINESLMYLGQCLQLQSDQSDSNKPAVVPFRQCKLTELLFSNSFPSAHASHAQSHRNPQKGVMIVTADPVGDFNATSQILRYSALAREITVPRIPSVTSIVFHGAPNPAQAQGRGAHGQSGRISPHDYSVELEVAAAEIEGLNDQLELMTMHLVEERARRQEAEENWQKADERAESIELEVRSECFDNMEKRLEEERRRWMNAMSEEADLNDAHLDRKLEILAQGIQIHEDPPATHVLDLEDENAALHRRIASLEREILGRSPKKPQRSTPLREIKLADEDVFESDNKENERGLIFQLETLNPNSGVEEDKGAETKQIKVPRTPGKKLRKLTPRTNVGFGDEDLAGLGSP